MFASKFGQHMKPSFLTTFSMRSFSQALHIGKPMLIPTEYLVSTAKVCVQMPTQGDTWFFLDPSTTVTQFKNACLQEDTQLGNVEVLAASGNVGED